MRAAAAAAAEAEAEEEEEEEERAVQEVAAAPAAETNAEVEAEPEARTGAQTAASAASRAVARDQRWDRLLAVWAASAPEALRGRDTGAGRVAAVTRRRVRLSRDPERRAGIVAARMGMGTRVPTTVRPGADWNGPPGRGPRRPRSALRRAESRLWRLGRARECGGAHGENCREPPMAAPTDWVSGIRASSGACVSQESGPTTRRILVSETSTKART